MEYILNSSQKMSSFKYLITKKDRYKINGLFLQK